MRRAEVRFLPLPRRRSIASAVIGGTQMRTALDDAARRLPVGDTGGHKFRTGGIDGIHTRMTGPIPVARPLPDIANHIVEPVAVRLEASDRRGSGMPVVLGVEDRKDALPGIGNRLAVSVESTRPVVLAVAAATGGEFPLRCRLRSGPLRRVLGHASGCHIRTETTLLPGRSRRTAPGIR